MPRVSRKQADQHRQDVLDAASRLFLEHGIDGVSVPDVMAEAGLTHGGFYGHFTSKEALVAEACTKAFEDRRSAYEGFIERNGSDRNAARAEFIKRYTSKAHRDAVGLGCPAAAMCGDLARENPRGSVRAAFATAIDTSKGSRRYCQVKRKPQHAKKRSRSSLCSSADWCSRGRLKVTPCPRRFCSPSDPRLSMNSLRRDVGGPPVYAGILRRLGHGSARSRLLSRRK